MEHYIGRYDRQDQIKLGGKTHFAVIYSFQQLLTGRPVFKRYPQGYFKQTPTIEESSMQTPTNKGKRKSESQVSKMMNDKDDAVAVSNWMRTLHVKAKHHPRRLFAMAKEKPVYLYYMRDSHRWVVSSIFRQEPYIFQVNLPSIFRLPSEQPS
jgi:hypothetical protein